jgi:hypothetical protein
MQEPERTSASEDPLNRKGKRVRKARRAEDVRREWVDGADGCRSLFVGNGPSFLVFDTDGKFKSLLIVREYLRKRLGKLTRAKGGEDRFDHEFLVGQLEALGKPGSISQRYKRLRADLDRIYTNSLTIDEDLPRYCMLVPILESIRQILIQSDDLKAKHLLSRLATRVKTARKLLTGETDDKQKFEAHEAFIKAIEEFARENDREPTMVEIRKLRFLDRGIKGDDQRRTVRTSQLAKETGFSWLPEGKHGPGKSLNR